MIENCRRLGGSNSPAIGDDGGDVKVPSAETIRAQLRTPTHAPTPVSTSTPTSKNSTIKPSQTGSSTGIFPTFNAGGGDATQQLAAALQASLMQTLLHSAATHGNGNDLNALAAFSALHHQQQQQTNNTPTIEYGMNTSYPCEMCRSNVPGTAKSLGANGCTNVHACAYQYSFAVAHIKCHMSIVNLSCPLCAPAATNNYTNWSLLQTHIGRQHAHEPVCARACSYTHRPCVTLPGATHTRMPSVSADQHVSFVGWHDRGNVRATRAGDVVSAMFTTCAASMDSTRTTHCRTFAYAQYTCMLTHTHLSHRQSTVQMYLFGTIL
jgi:hypothetical protein